MNQPLDVASLVLMQAFYWEPQEPHWWCHVASKIEPLAQAGFDAVWLPPVSKAADRQGYLPNELYNLNTSYGTKDDLLSLLDVIHQHRMIALADLVLNHRVGTHSHSDFTNPTWGSDAVVCDDEHPGTGQPDTGAGFHAGRDIDHTNATIRVSIIDWMLHLKTLGFDGWRYDYVRGFAGRYIATYNQATNAVFSVGEYWDNFDIGNPNAHRQQLCDWLDAHGGRASVFDFTTKGLLQWAIQQKQYGRLVDANHKPAGLIGWWPEKAVTFIDNHDTSIEHQGGQKYWPFPTEALMQGYAYILLHPGVPCVYWYHYFKSGLQPKIDALLSIRKRLGLHASSQAQILDVNNTHYAVIVDQKVCLKIGQDAWHPTLPLPWDSVIREKDYEVWIRG